ncbi:MAG: hypothetical protein FJ090_02415 [Deltaproteobacteria bacterium]|nr:hypothetical protein [Deltaproteobacteria bacterium]
MILLVAIALAQPFRFDRVDILAEDPGTWINYDLPQAPVAFTQTAVRLVEQVSVQWQLPVTNLYLGTSIASQSLTYELPWKHGLGVHGGLQTSLLLPRGAVLGAHWRTGRVRLGLGASVISSATWAHVDYSQWHVLPTIGVGVGRKYEAPAG